MSAAVHDTAVRATGSPKRFAVLYGDGSLMVLPAGASYAVAQHEADWADPDTVRIVYVTVAEVEDAPVEADRV